MNNYQWLLQMDGAERKAWFDAEHVETEERALDGDTEPESSNTDAVSERYATAFKWLDRLDYGKGGVIGGSLCDTPEQGEVVMPLESWREYLGAESENADSREKLETDVRRIADAYNMDTQRHGTERFAHELYYSIIHLLDRQRAIDDSICDECSSDYYEMQEEHDQMLDGIAKLMRKQPYTFDYGKPLENIETIGRYIDELTAERDKLKELNGYHVAQYELASEDCDRLQADADRLQAQVDELTVERERYREKFGKCLDYADAIHALMDDEGMA